ncbi:MULTISPECIES: TetR/AcrR family transcriptional regulator [Streptomyces]|uniref:TetR/AcrR family transcriptional regulator n=1 Tax=Streptomyces TaxID=1883 RepID=UPI00163CE397|nr:MULTISPECIES: TetR/AcrR family transcriptional regulator [Streptomyces]MBC2877217.1 TetR family transcriptional regulator [Streptomyces sp. TYQ1024]UBI39483.1 TetR family transcriptional regulator [Streptomyces mobaraensis]UKW32062.1 TetR family transcriptional regulator [Streptomyces sp. TYQ1024]
MRAKSSEPKQGAAPTADRTFTEAARRAQIVDAAIEVIAEVGYAKASFSRIARQAGLSSTGMISYHFAGKDDLMREVVAEVIRVADAYMRPRIEAHRTAPERLRAHIESNLALLDVYPKHLHAMVEVLTGVRGESPSAREFTAVTDAMLDTLIAAARRGQEAGEFGEFDPATMVYALRGAIDALVMRAAHDPDFDAAAHGRRLADLFDRATRSTP